jgi:hypothetical protein
MVTKLLRLIGTIWGKTRLRVKACLWLFSGRPGGFAGVVRAHLRGPAREGEGHYFLIRGEGLDLIAGKVKTCFSTGLLPGQSNR